jgi:ribosomal protein L27
MVEIRIKTLGIARYLEVKPQSQEISSLDKRGYTHNPGDNVYGGKDHTLHAKVDWSWQIHKK